MGHKEDIQRWRRTMRRKLLTARREAGRPQRDQWNAIIERRLRHLLPDLRGRVLGLYWPFKGEFDARALAAELGRQGARTALPAVARRREPLEYRPWQPGDPVEPGEHNVPVPVTRETVQPDVLLVPLLGFDAECYRLGYGTGYFDRTIAALAAKPTLIGIGYEISRLDSIFPQAHDVPMDVVVTERDMFRRPDASGGAGLAGDLGQADRENPGN